MTNPIPPNEKINILFTLVVQSNGKPFTNKEVARFTGIRDTTLSNLRNNPTVNPTLTTLQGICRFFKVPLDYFNCETESECRAFLENLPYASAILDEDVDYSNPVARQIYIKAMNMSEQGQRQALHLLEWMEAGDKVLHDRQQAAAAS